MKLGKSPFFEPSFLHQTAGCLPGSSLNAQDLALQLYGNCASIVQAHDAIHFLVSPRNPEMIQFDEYFSDGLEPPTRLSGGLK